MRTVGTEDDRVLLERVQIAGADSLVETAALEDQRRQVELVVKLLAPLLAQVGGEDDQEAPLSLGPLLRQKKAGLNRFPQTHLVRQDRAFREGATKGKKRRFDLVRVQIDLGIGEH